MEKNFFGREADVLGGGLSQGLSDIAQNTWSDLSKGAKDFVHNPIDTASTYVGNHWQDLAAGAAIGLLNPKGLILNGALLAWATRGLWTSVGKAAWEAGHEGNDNEASKRKLSEAVSHEGTAFLGSMPMAMLGGMTGKASAEAIFGKDLGAKDLLTSKLTGDQVKANLMNIKDTVVPPGIKLVVTDFDGTVAPFYDYFAPGLRDNIRSLSSKTGVAEDEIYKSIGKITNVNRTHDYPWSLELSGLMQRFGMQPKQFTDEVVKPFWEGMDKARADYLKPFPEAVSTLQELAKRNIPVVALSDAPFYIVLNRAKTAGVDGLIERLYALETVEPKAGSFADPSLVDYGRARVRDMSNVSSGFEYTKVLPKAFEKPNPQGLDMIMQDYGVRPNETLFIGDSRVKDGGVAQARGVKFIWARHGAHPASEYVQTMDRLEPPKVAPVELDSTGNPLPPKPKVYPPIAAEAASYAEVLKHLDPKANYWTLGKDVTGTLLTTRPPLAALLGYDLFPGQISTNDQTQSKTP